MTCKPLAILVLIAAAAAASTTNLPPPVTKAVVVPYGTGYAGQLLTLGSNGIGQWSSPTNLTSVATNVPWGTIKGAISNQPDLALAFSNQSAAISAAAAAASNSVQRGGDTMTGDLVISNSVLRLLNTSAQSWDFWSWPDGTLYLINSPNLGGTIFRNIESTEYVAYLSDIASETTSRQLGDAALSNAVASCMATNGNASGLTNFPPSLATTSSLAAYLPLDGSGILTGNLQFDDYHGIDGANYINLRPADKPGVYLFSSVIGSIAHLCISNVTQGQTWTVWDVGNMGAITLPFDAITNAPWLTVYSETDPVFVAWSNAYQGKVTTAYSLYSTNLFLAVASGAWCDAPINSGPTANNSVWPVAVSSGIGSHWTCWTSGMASQQSQYVYADFAPPARGVKTLQCVWWVSNTVDALTLDASPYGSASVWSTNLVAASAGALQTNTFDVSTSAVWTNQTVALRLRVGVYVSTNATSGAYGYTAQPMILVGSL